MISIMEKLVYNYDIGFTIWSVTLIGKRLVLKTSVALKSDKGSNPLHSAINLFFSFIVLFWGQ